LVNRLVFENLKHRPVRTVLSAVAIGVQVTMILTLVGVSYGMLNDLAERSRGTGADIMVRPPGSSLIGSSGNMPEAIVTKKVRPLPHVALATGTLVQPIGGINTITGVHLDEFDQMSGGFRYLAGGPFQDHHDLIIDEVFARSQHVHVGDNINLGLNWRVAGIVEPGKLSRTFAEIQPLQEMYSANGMISVIWIKVDDHVNIPVVINELKQAGLEDYSILSVEDYTSLISVDNIPMLRPFTRVVIGLAVVIGFLVVFLSMYTAVLERTREIGILKALGASPAYILGILLRETVLLSIAGSLAGILMTYGTRQLLSSFVPTMVDEMVYIWWPIAGAIALAGSLIGAIYPGLKAARQDAIEALSYD
jgi:putative ABC transport system permease protein